MLQAYERLSHTADMAGKPWRDYLHGNDKYASAAQFAGLGLLISHLHADHYKGVCQLVRNCMNVDTVAIDFKLNMPYN